MRLSPRRFLETVRDEWKYIRTEKSVLLILVAIPIIYPIIIASLYSTNQVTERPVILIDADNSALSRRFALRLDSTQEIRVIGSADSLEEAWNRLKRLKAEAVIFIPEDFSRRVMRGEMSKVMLWVYTANVLTYGTSYPGLSNVVMDLNEELSREYFHSKGMNTKAAAGRTMPVKKDIHQLYHPRVSYGDFLVTGVMLIVIQQLVLIGLSFSVGLRRETEKAKEGADSLFEIAARLSAQLVFYVMGIFFIIFVVYPLFGYPIQSRFGMFLTFAGFILAISPLAVMVAHFMPDRYAAFQILMFLSTPLFMMSGFAWPLDQMPAYIRFIAYFFAPTPACLAVRQLSMKTGELLDVLPYFVWLAGLFCLYAGIVWYFVIHRRKPRPAD